VLICLESKVFGIGVESYTVGSAEFTMNYVAKHGLVPLMDNGHYHPTEVVSDKLSSMFLFNDKVALHVTRGVRWDSDHVVRLDDETREIAKELVASGRMSDVALALDYFDASINRTAAWIIGTRNFRKALLIALLEPRTAAAAEKQFDYTGRLAAQEAAKSLPWGAVWDEFLARCDMPDDFQVMSSIREYEKRVLAHR
jgi:L-rhamnose isomerase